MIAALAVGTGTGIVIAVSAGAVFEPKQACPILVPSQRREVVEIEWVVHAPRLLPNGVQTSFVELVVRSSLGEKRLDLDYASSQPVCPEASSEDFDRPTLGRDVARLTFQAGDRSGYFARRSSNDRIEVGRWNQGHHNRDGTCGDLRGDYSGLPCPREEWGLTGMGEGRAVFAIPADAAIVETALVSDENGPPRQMRCGPHD